MPSTPRAPEFEMMLSLNSNLSLVFVGSLRVGLMLLTLLSVSAIDSVLRCLSTYCETVDYDIVPGLRPPFIVSRIASPVSFIMLKAPEC